MFLICYFKISEVFSGKQLRCIIFFLDTDEIREFILSKTSEINEKLDKKIEVVPCSTTLTQVTFKNDILENQFVIFP
jgi:hypothetical protein